MIERLSYVLFILGSWFGVRTFIWKIMLPENNRDPDDRDYSFSWWLTWFLAIPATMVVYIGLLLIYLLCEWIIFG